MAGCCVVVLMCIVMPLMIVALLASAAYLIGLLLYLVYSFVLEGIFLMRVGKASGDYGPLQAWIPIWGQYLLGKLAGSGKLGALLALDHVAAAAVVICGCLTREYILWLLLILGLLAVLGFIVKAVLCHRIFHLAQPKYDRVLTIANVLTLGLIRPACLFLLRNNPALSRKNT